MQGPSSFQGALHAFHSTSEGKPLKGTAYPSVAAGLTARLNNMCLRWQLLHRSIFAIETLLISPQGVLTLLLRSRVIAAAKC